MTAGLYDFKIEQGASFKKTITLPAEFSLDGCKARLQIRRYALKPDPTLATWTTENGHITLDNTAHTVTIVVTAADTAALSSADSTPQTTVPFGVYDLEIVYPDGVVTRLLQGSVNLSLEVTR